MEDIIKKENPELFKKMKADQKKYGRYLVQENRKTIQKIIQEKEKQKEKDSQEFRDRIRIESKPILNGRHYFLIENNPLSKE